MCLHKIELSQIPVTKQRPPYWLWVLAVASLLLCLWTPSKASAQQYKVPNVPSCQSMSLKQWSVLSLAYQIGLSSNLGYTLTAIAWEESKGGLYTVNNDLSDFGVMQVNIKNIKAYAPKQPTGRLVQRHITDASYNIETALKILVYFEDYWEGDWQLAVRSYNAGFKHTDAVKYQLRIAAYVRAFRQPECRGLRV